MAAAHSPALATTFDVEPIEDRHQRQLPIRRQRRIAVPTSCGPPQLTAASNWSSADVEQRARRTGSFPNGDVGVARGSARALSQLQQPSAPTRAKQPATPPRGLIAMNTTCRLCPRRALHASGYCAPASRPTTTPPVRSSGPTGQLIPHKPPRHPGQGRPMLGEPWRCRGLGCGGSYDRSD